MANSIPDDEMALPQDELQGLRPCCTVRLHAGPSEIFDETCDREVKCQPVFVAPKRLSGGELTTRHLRTDCPGLACCS
jgi:hypothetical protein